MRVALTVCSILLTGIINAQDTIFLTNNRKPLVGKVVSVKYGRVKYHLPEKKNARLITARFIDSVKYENGQIDESLGNARFKKVRALNYQQERKELARLKHEQFKERVRERNSFVDPYSNRISIGVQAISTSIFIVKPIFPRADISAALGTNISIEKSFLRNRVGVVASAFWSWNKTTEGLMLAGRYYFINRPTFRVGVGAAYAYSFFGYKVKPPSKNEILPIEGEQLVKPSYFETHASTFVVNYAIQKDINKRIFIGQDIYWGGTNYFKTSPDKAFLSNKLNFGWKF